MDRFPYASEDREDQVCQVIDSRIKAIHHDIRIGRMSTTERVLARLEVGATRDQALAILRAAVVGHSQAVGFKYAGAVQAAIYFEAEALAELDVADMERARAESRDENTVARATAACAFA